MRALVVAIVFILFTSETFAQSPVTCIGIIRQQSCATVVDFPGPAPNPGDRPCDPVPVALGCVPEYAYKIGLGGWDTVVNSSGGYVGAGVSGVEGSFGTWICEAKRPCKYIYDDKTNTDSCILDPDSASTVVTLSFHYATFLTGETCVGAPD